MKTFFISSTFRDMQAERDILHERIFPKLRGLLKAYGESVQEVDLRWGVDTVNMTEEESGHEVLKICFDAIDRCRPYLIVLLGDRYGWIPGPAIVDSADDLRISGRYEAEMSITELEIQYGALLNDTTFSECIFCFRDPAVVHKIGPAQQANYRSESRIHARRLEALKRLISSRDNAVILEYSAQWDEERNALCGLEEFERRLYLLLEDMLTRDLAGYAEKNAMDRQADEIALMQRLYLSAYVRRYLEEFAILRQISEFVEHRIDHTSATYRNGVLVSGDAGIGKSALMAFTADLALRYKLSPILCFANTSGCREAGLLKRFIAYRLETILGKAHNENYRAIDEYLRMLNGEAKDKRIVCFVDGLDQIYHGQLKPYLDLPALCPNVFWVFSALPEFPFREAACDCDYPVIHVENLFRNQKTDIVTRTAARRGKKLDDQIVDMITESPGSANPLFLSLVLQRFFMMNKAEFEEAESMAPGMEGLHRYMQEMMTRLPEQPGAMAEYILRVTAGLFDNQQFSEVLMLLAVSKNGLTEQEISDILWLEGLRFSPLRFQQTVSYLYDGFTQNSSGKWIFHHRLFAEAVDSAMSEADRRRILRLLAQYSLADEDFLRQEGFRYLLELKDPAFSLVLEKADQWDSAAQILDLVGTAARDHHDYRQFLTELMRDHPSEGAADFWLAFDEYLYGPDVRDMASEITGILMDAAVGDSRKWKLALRRLYFLPQEDCLPTLALARTHAAALPEPEASIANAAIQAKTALCLTWLHQPRAEIREAWRAVRSHADRAVASMGDQVRWEDLSAVLASLRSAASVASDWDDPDAGQMLHRVMGLLEQARQFADKADFRTHKARTMLGLRRFYSKKSFYDPKKAKHFCRRALLLAERAVSEMPSVQNLILMSDVLISYAHLLSADERHPYLHRRIDCNSQIYAIQKTDDHKYRLARSQAEYAASVLGAARTGSETLGVKEIKGAYQLFDQSCQLYEELIRSGCSESWRSSYAALLGDRTNYDVQKGYIQDTFSHGKRCLELFEENKALCEKRLLTITDPDARREEQRKRGWILHWMATVKRAFAGSCLLQLDGEGCRRWADEAMSLASECDRTDIRCYELLLDCAKLAAQGAYMQRRDAEALGACDTARQLMDDPRAGDCDCREIRAELAYIGARIALEQGDTDRALAYRSECEQLAQTTILKNKLLILKADYLTAVGDPRSDDAWLTALQAWRRQVEEERRLYDRPRTVNLQCMDGKYYQSTYWAETRAYALTAYYMGYCYHHYVVSWDRMRRGYDEEERNLLYALSYLDKGYLRGRQMPYVQVLEMTDDTVEPEYPAVSPDLDSFVDTLETMAERKDYTAYEWILKYRDLLAHGVPTESQYAKLARIIPTMYQLLISTWEGSTPRLEKARERAAFYAKALPLEKALPAFWVEEIVERDCCWIWKDTHADRNPARWYAMLRLLVFTLRRDDGKNDDLFTWLNGAYQWLSRYLGSKDLIKADIGSLPSEDLEDLIALFDIRRESWYEPKNVWLLELTRRSGDRTYIRNRVAAFAQCLADDWVPVDLDGTPLSRRDLANKIGDALNHLIRGAAEKISDQAALEIAQWSEASPQLAGLISYRRLEDLRTQSPADQAWLSELKMRYCRQWLDACRSTKALNYL